MGDKAKTEQQKDAASEPLILANDGDQPDLDDSADDQAAGDGGVQPDQVETDSGLPDADEQTEQHYARTSAQSNTRHGGFIPAVLGGIVAAAIGFWAARTEILDQFLPGQSRHSDIAADIARLNAASDTQAKQITSLTTNLSGQISTELAPLSAQQAQLAKRVDQVVAQVGNIESQVSQVGSLATRLSELEKRPISENVSQAAIAAYERELAALQDTVASQKAEVSKILADARKMEAQAVAAEQAADAKTAAALLQSALDNGAPFADSLETLKSTGATIPSGLVEHAETGVPTLAALQAEFPPVARRALALVRDSSESGGLGAFLQRQLGARSVAPRVGDDPDAVLSRAEAALTNGHLSESLAEIATLPDVARPALANWVKAAETRSTALNAAQILVQKVGTN